jgi:hypothetical protein
MFHILFLQSKIVNCGSQFHFPPERRKCTIYGFPLRISWLLMIESLEDCPKWCSRAISTLGIKATVASTTCSH